MKTAFSLSFYIFCFLIIPFSTPFAQTNCQDPIVPAPAPLPGQLWAGSDKTFYGVGETITFRILSNVDGPCTYTIREDRFLPVLKTETVNLTANQETTVTFQMDRPTFLVFTVNQGGPDVTAGVAVDACDIAPTAYLPDDFDRFWDSLKTELAKVPINPQVTQSAAHSDAAQTTYKMVLDNIDGKKVYGWISIPNCPGPFGAVLTLPSFGSTPIGPSSYDAFDGIIGVSISIHDFDCEQTVPPDIAYAPANHFYDRQTNYYKAAILGCIRAIDFLFTRPEFDGVHMAVTGVSQGGGLALMTAGLDPRVKYVAQGVTALCNHAAYASDRSSGFPYWVKSGVEQGGNADLIIRETGYYDVVNFARKYKGPSYNFVGYNDEVCPPASVFAAYNQMTGYKTMFHSITTGHTNPPNFWGDRIDFWVSQGVPYSKFFAGCPPVPGPDVVAPAAVSDLTLSYAGYDSLRYTFKATGDDLNDGTAYRYDIRYSTDTITAGNFDQAPKAELNIYPFVSGTPQNYTLTGLDSATIYFLGIRAIDEADNEGPVEVLKGKTLGFVVPMPCVIDSIQLATQQEIDNFSAQHPGCTEVVGALRIQGVHSGAIKNLDGLAQLTRLGSLVVFENDSLASLQGLHNVAEIKNAVQIANNARLNDLSALNKIDSLADFLTILSNEALENLNGLSNLEWVGKDVRIAENGLLSTLTHLGKLKTIGRSLLILKNPGLSDLDGLQQVDSIGNYFYVEDNDGLVSLSGLGSTVVKGLLLLFGNDNLASLAGMENLKLINGITIFANDNLTSLNGFSMDSMPLGVLDITSNPRLKSLAGLESLQLLGSTLVISDNDSLEHLGGLENLKYVGGEMYITLNAVLISLEALDSLQVLKEKLTITENAELVSLKGLDNIDPDSLKELLLAGSPKLSECAVESICTYLKTASVQAVTINGNATGCATRIEVESDCISVSAEPGAGEAIVEVFPNPFHTALNIRGISNGIVTLFDVLGKTKKTAVFNGAPVALHDLPSGMYWLQIRTDAGMITRKVIKE